MIRRKCHIKPCTFGILLVLLAVNLLAYYLLDIGSVTATYDPFTKNSPQSKDTPATEKRAEFLKPQKIVADRKQKYVSAEEPKNTASVKAAQQIYAAKDSLRIFNMTSLDYKKVLETVLSSLETGRNGSLSLTEKWLTGSEIVPEDNTQLGSLLTTLCSLKITKADNSRKGTQLKLQLTLEGGFTALFKPQWYERDTVIHGPVYAGKDRHNAEVAAFHLSLLLNMRLVPLTVGRRIDLRREVIPVATPALKKTFFQEGNNTCFYGICHYCSPVDPVCARRDVIEGALILWLPNKFKFVRYTHPWQRTYVNRVPAKWEVDVNYCKKVQSTKTYSMKSSQRLLNLIDTAIFDFLIDNGDRHHYESPIDFKSVFLFDNGKSFGDPDTDHLDILAPLYQCCLLRRKTWETLFKFRGGVLGKSLEETLKWSHIAPVLTATHFAALDRRLLLVFAAVEVCLRDQKKRPVLI